jgi:[histone H3]-lysine79 N-trimethyltransferase
MGKKGKFYPPFGMPCLPGCDARVDAVGKEGEKLQMQTTQFLVPGTLHLGYLHGGLTVCSS